jgi:cyclic beta-1,2-glucan synthetase
MNRVGEKGEGESVWLGWFIHAALDGLRASCRSTRRKGTRRTVA